MRTIWNTPDKIAGRGTNHFPSSPGLYEGFCLMLDIAFENNLTIYICTVE